ncbi:HsdM family class I SAM-dependent methyltransferase [Collinsella intestinalis]|uniref:class I SAM-dependent DNA methyltransferase n=1 Tax=Collinsella intestinalis TaxID=147207 RepID=UPI001956F00F|nr:class I SAM-dependent DNA methyltransferase [Collinsella intestinalis]MBM6683671.1 SAM-dependent DNA methyltransferase [Collinsella intestinalis]
MALGTLVKTLQNIMRKDAGINGDAQRIEQMTWLFFLKIYDAKEEEWEFHDDSYESIIPERLRWHSWAVDHKDGKALTGEALLDFVNNDLFKTLPNLELSPNAPLRQVVVKAAFTDANNYMKDGILLRQVVNEIDNAVDFTEYKERHAFGEIYETILKDLQSAGNAGEFYTPRAVTDFMAQALAPKLGERVADFACGTGGFLTSALKILAEQVKTPADQELYTRSIYGIEKKQLPYLLCITNMLLHDIDNPEIFHDNSLESDVREWRHKQDGQFDVILMNPPYGGSENTSIQNNFPTALRSSETADLFLGLILYRLKKDGRAAVIIPDGFLFGQDAAKVEIKRRLLEEMNLHTVVRMPQSVFAPYTSITTNILFFSNTKPSEGVWFYRIDMPEGYKHFSKTKPIRLEHFDNVKAWWDNRHEIIEDGNPKAKFYTVNELRSGNFNLDLCGYPHEEEEILPPDELIRNYKEERARLDAEIDQKLMQICEILGIEA